MKEELMKTIKNDLREVIKDIIYVQSFLKSQEKRIFEIGVKFNLLMDILDDERNGECNPALGDASMRAHY